MRILWLDDIRDPLTSPWIRLIFQAAPEVSLSDICWVKSFDHFVHNISTLGLPEIIFFDHDLGEKAMNHAIEQDFKDFDYSKVEEKTGYDCVKWLINYCEENNLSIPVYYFQTANPVGKENMQKLLQNYDNYKRSQISGQ